MAQRFLADSRDLALEKSKNSYIKGLLENEVMQDLPQRTVQTLLYGADYKKLKSTGEMVTDFLAIAKPMAVDPYFMNTCLRQFLFFRFFRGTEIGIFNRAKFNMNIVMFRNYTQSRLILALTESDISECHERRNSMVEILKNC